MLDSVIDDENDLSWSIGKDKTYQDRLGRFYEFIEKHPVPPSLRPGSQRRDVSTIACCGLTLRRGQY